MDFRYYTETPAGAYTPNNYDYNFQKYVGWEQTIYNNENYKYLFSEERLKIIQDKIHQILRGVRRDGRPILVSLDSIAAVLTQVMNSNNPRIGSIYSRYIQPDPEAHRNDLQQLVDRTIEIITTQIITEQKLDENNKELTIWDTLYGDFNRRGLRQHSSIKIRNRHPAYFQFTNLRF